MAGTDYDAPRVKPEEQEKDEALEEARAKLASNGDKVDDEPNLDEAITLPGADLSGVELEVEVVPQQSDEFTAWAASWFGTGRSWLPGRRPCASTARSRVA